MSTAEMMGAPDFEPGADVPPKRRPPEGPRLRENEVAELELLWSPSSWDPLMEGGMIRSNMGAIRDRLLRGALPNEGQARHAILSELARAGGRMPEGKLLRIVCFEKACSSRREAMCALKLLRDYGKIERIKTEMPADRKRGPAPTRGQSIEDIDVEVDEQLTSQEQRDWSGCDVRYVPAGERAERRKAARAAAKEKNGGLGRKGSRRRVDAAAALLEHLGIDAEEIDREETAAVEQAVRERHGSIPGLDRSERAFARQCEEIRRLWNTIEVHDDASGGYMGPEQMISPARRRVIDRAMAALALIPGEMRRILRYAYGGGGGPRPTDAQVDEACIEYRAARRAVRKATRRGT